MLTHIRSQKRPACWEFVWDSPSQDKVVTGADITQHFPQLVLQLADGPHSVLETKYFLAEDNTSIIQIDYVTTGKENANLAAELKPGDVCCHHIKITFWNGVYCNIHFKIIKLEMTDIYSMLYCRFYTRVHTSFTRRAPVEVLNLGASDSPLRNSLNQPSSWSTQFWLNSCSLAVCSSSRGSQTRWHPDDNPLSCTSWTTERRPLQGLSMPCSPGRRLDSVMVDWVSIHYQACITWFISA